MTQLDLMGNPNLEILNCENNQLTQLDLTGNPNLEILNCEKNQLTSITISNNSQLKYVNCMGNQLSMSAMQTFIYNLPEWSDNDGKLYFCSDEVGDGNMMSPEQVAALRDKGWKVYKSVNGSYEIYEGVEPTIYLTAAFFPDAALRSRIASITGLNEGDELTDEKIENITVLDLKNSGVTDITGYQYLTNLHQFVTYGIVLSRLDVSMLPELELLDCTSNRGLNVLDLSNNKKLRHLKCSGNRLQSLDVSMLPNLQTLYCDQNYLSSLKMGSHPDLRQVQCQGNFLNAIQMGKVVDALPQLPNNMPGKLMVMDSSIEPSRTNTIYTSQVAEAKAKGWQVVNQNNQIYEGSDPVIGSGDADMSTTLDEWDLQIVSDYILGYVPDQYPGFDQIAADVNGDGRITIADVTIIIDKMKSPTSED
jgi:Leucine-rich repeat (LRR) protein